MLLVRLPTALSCPVNAGPEGAPSQSLMQVSFPRLRPWQSARICKQEEGQRTESAPQAGTPSLYVLWVHSGPYMKSALDFYLLLSRAQVFCQGHRKRSRQLFDNGARKKIDKTHALIGDSSSQLWTVINVSGSTFIWLCDSFTGTH